MSRVAALLDTLWGKLDTLDDEAWILEQEKRKVSKKLKDKQAEKQEVISQLEPYYNGEGEPTPF